jgi:hypothetical protein
VAVESHSFAVVPGSRPFVAVASHSYVVVLFVPGSSSFVAVASHSLVVLHSSHPFVVVVASGPFVILRFAESDYRSVQTEARQSDWANLILGFHDNVIKIDYNEK